MNKRVLIPLRVHVLNHQHLIVSKCGTCICVTSHGTFPPTADVVSTNSVLLVTSVPIVLSTCTLSVYSITTTNPSLYFRLGSFPGHSPIQYLIACSMQIQRGKAWVIWSRAVTLGRQRVDAMWYPTKNLKALSYAISPKAGRTN